MTANPLRTEHSEKPKLSLKEQCDYANAQLTLKDINADRHRQGLAPVRWVLRNGRVTIEQATE